MATAFTHVFVAGWLTPLGPERALRGRLAFALCALAVLPDLDVIGFRLGIPYEHPLGHRGWTHSLSFALVAGVSVAGLAFRRLGPGSRDWWRVAVLLSVATASHGVLDALTDAGLGVGFLLPFHDGRYFAPWRPLATSPLSIRAFFDGPALAILAREIVWVWLPVTGIALLASVARRQRQRAARPGSD